MATIDPSTFIQNQILMGLAWAGFAEDAINSATKGLYTYTPYNVGMAELSNYPFATYTAPVADTTPNPVYVAPNAAIPTLPVLTDPNAIPVPVLPVSPAAQVSATISSLFQQQAPSTNMPTWNYSIPDLQADELIAEMNALALPVIMSPSFPVLSALNLPPAPTLNLPSFDQPATPNIPQDPTDYAALAGTTYDTYSVGMQGFINDQVANWISLYGPELNAMSAQIAQKVTDGLSATVLPDQIEAAMITRARSRASADFYAVELSIDDRFKENGCIEPPGQKESARLLAQLATSNALANQSTDIYIERRKTEVQHLQFVMTLAASNMASLRGLAVMWGHVTVSSMQNAISYSTLIGSMAVKLYEHLLAKADLTVAIMKVLAEMYEVRLKAALSALDGYRLQLEAAKLTKDVEMMQVQIISEQIRVQELEVNCYSAIIAAIERKANVEELKLKTLNAEAQILDTQVKLQIAGFDVYKAALQGDEAKLEGALGLEKIYTSELEAAKTVLEANIKSNDAIIASNNAKVEMFDAGAKVYNLNLDTAIKQFEIGASVKKMAQSVYMTNVDASVKVFDATLETQKVTINTILQEYEARLKNYEINTQLQLGIMQNNSKVYETIGNATADVAGHVISTTQGLATSVINQ